MFKCLIQSSSRVPSACCICRFCIHQFNQRFNLGNLFESVNSKPADMGGGGGRGRQLYTQPGHVYMCDKLLPTLCNPMDCSPPGSSVHGILQARTLKWVAVPSSKGSSQPRDRTHISCFSCTGRWVLYH